MAASRSGTGSIARIFLVLLLAASLAAAQDELQGYRDAVARGDYNAAAAALRPVADRGSAEAQYRYAMLFAAGRGVRPSDALAASWLRRAADQGHAPAQYELGRMYLDGRGVPLDGHEARAWLTKAAQSGYAPATRLLQRMSPGN